MTTVKLDLTDVNGNDVTDVNGNQITVLGASQGTQWNTNR